MLDTRCACDKLQQIQMQRNHELPQPRMIDKSSTYRTEVYWTGSCKKAGIRDKKSGGSKLHMIYPSYTVLIKLCNQVVS